MAYQQRKIDLHTYIWVRFNGEVDDDCNDVISEKTTSEGITVTLSKKRLIKKNDRGEILSQFIFTTPGRVIFNSVFEDVSN